MSNLCDILNCDLRLDRKSNCFWQVSEHASWSGCFYFRIIQSALAAVGAPENLVDIITGYF